MIIWDLTNHFKEEERAFVRVTCSCVFIFQNMSTCYGDRRISFDGLNE